MPLKVKARRCIVPSSVGEGEGGISTRKKDFPKNIYQFIRQRLNGAPLFTHNGRIKSEYKTAADEIAHLLLTQALEGNRQAINIILEATEGDYLRQKHVNILIFKIFRVIEELVEDEDLLYRIGSALYRLKHNYHEKELYTGPKDLHPAEHEDDNVKTRLSHLAERFRT